MDESKICERSVNCPIFTGVLEENKVLIQTYKNLYCHAGTTGRKKCKRFQVYMRIDTCPPELLPNSQLTVDDILKRMEHQK